MRSFVKIISSRNDEIALTFVNMAKPCPSHGFLISQICLLMLFAKIKFSRRFPNLQYDMEMPQRAQIDPRHCEEKYRTQTVTRK